MKFINRDNINNYLSSRIPTLLIIFIMINIISDIPSENIISDILSHFQIQYLFICLFFILFTSYLLFINKKFLIYLFLAITVLGIKIFNISPTYPTNTFHVNNSQAIKIGLFNVLTSNTNYQGLINEIEKQNPDIVILQEIDDLWITHLKPLNNKYKYNIRHIRYDNFGIAMFSKLPIINYQIEKWTGYEIPVIKAKLKLENKDILLYAIHTLPPISNEYIKTRNDMLKKINTISNSNKKKILIAGDLNTTIYSHAYKKYISNSNLYDIQTNLNNIQGTWNTKHPNFMRISLDHVLVSKDIKGTDFNIGKDFGSDHLPIFVKIMP